MSKSIRRFIAPAAALVGNAVAPGIGGVIGGALGGAASGGGLKGALTGGLSGGAIGFAPQIGALANSALGTGLSTAGQSVLGGALGGAASGALSGGGVSGALTGGLTGGLGGYLANGGLGQIGDSLGIGSVGDMFGSSGAVPAANVGKAFTHDPNLPWLSDVAMGTAKANPFTTSAPSGGLSGLSSLLGGGGGSMFTSGLSALNQFGANKKMEKDMLEAQRRAEGIISPYQQTGLQANQMLAQDLASGDLGGQFTMEDFQADPGYQFRKQQGEEALMRAQAARGGMFSGAALREASDLNQQLADQAYNDAYSRFMQQQQQRFGMLSGTSGAGQNAAGGLANIYDTMGNIRANSTLGQANAITGFAADVSNRDIIGFNPDGTPITRQSSLLGSLRGMM